MDSMISTGDIKKLATLARVGMSAEEIERMRTEVDSILDYLQTIQKISGTEKSDSIVARFNVMRDDSNPDAGGTHTETLLKASPKRKERYFKVKKIL